MIVLKILLLLCCIVLAFLVSNKIFEITSKDIKEAKGEIPDHLSNEFRQFKYVIEKLEGNQKVLLIFESRKKKLKKYGNYFKFITPLTYYLIKVISVLILLILLTKPLTIFTILLPLYLFFFIDIIYKLKNKEDNNKILDDLPKIYDILEINSYAGVDLSTSLVEVYEIVKNKRLKDKLINLAAEIKIKKNISEALDNFWDNFTLPEIQSFCLGIQQSIESGKNKEFLSNQGELLKKRNLNNKDKQTSKNNFRTLLSAMLIFTGILGITLFSFINQYLKELPKLINF